MLYGCDISKWQGEDFDISGEDFVIAKATEGRTYTDPLFHDNIAKALYANKLIGAYHYARPENGNSAKDEAQNFITEVQPYIGRCLLALDWEAEALNYPVEWALEWLQEVERITGVKPLIYCSYAFVDKLQVIADNGNGIWCARWSENKPDVTDVFDVMALWQYTSKPYDKDIFYGTRDAWQKYCDTTVNTGSCKCSCDFCKEFKEFLKAHGYVRTCE